MNLFKITPINQLLIIYYIMPHLISYNNNFLWINLNIVQLVMIYSFNENVEV